MNQVLEAKARAEDAAASTAAALAAAERKAKQYRYDSSTLLNDYDTWVQGLLAKKSTSGSGATAEPSSGTAFSGAAGQLSLSRTNSQGASPVQLQQQQQHAAVDLEKYDRIAALLDSRGVGAGLSKSLSSKSVGAAAPASPRAAATAAAPKSPRPAFR